MDEIKAKDRLEDDGQTTYDIGKLNELYRDSESCDQEVLAEMRSNVLIMAGQHYKKIQKGLARGLERHRADQSKRLRLVKNHTAKAINDIKDIMASMAPGVLPMPRHEDDRDAAKAAELAKPVWSHGEEENNYEELRETNRNSFCVVGEVVSKMYFDPIAGGIKAYEQKLTETGEPIYLTPDSQEVTIPKDLPPEMTPEMFAQASGLQPAPDKDRPQFRGKLTIQPIEPYNLLRPKNAKSMRTAKFLVVRNMVDLADAEAMIKAAKNLSDDEKKERLKWIESSGEEAYKIFDASNGGFKDSKGQILFREFYFRQSVEFPQGRFFITVKDGILFEGDLPFGEAGEIAYPISWAGYNLMEGSCRGFSQIKIGRPSQIEINRAASSWSETQITVGHDKIVLTKNSKFSRGVDQPGMRVFHTTDSAPVVIPGRDGGQYVAMLEHNVSELYKLMALPENANPLSQATDPRMELFKKQSQRARFSEPAGRLARFERDVCKKYLFFAQKYFSEDDLRAIVGKVKAVDIAEFKNVDQLMLKIELKEVTDDLDSMLGKTLTLETIIQYMGKSLDPETAKIILSEFPMINKSKSFKHLTMDLDNINSDILALDRGEYRPANENDDHALFIKHLTNRSKQRDFELLPDQVKQAYAKRIGEHNQFIAHIAQQEQEAAAGFIPSGGALAKADLYINPDPNNPGKVMKATFPTEALEWLKKRLDAQGSTQALLATIQNQGAMGNVAQMIGAGQGVGAQPQNVDPRQVLEATMPQTNGPQPGQEM